MENDRERSLQSWEFRTLFLPRPPPPRSQPRNARNYLVTASYEALQEAVDTYRLSSTRSAVTGGNHNLADRDANKHHGLGGRVPAHR